MNPKLEEYGAGSWRAQAACRGMSPAVFYPEGRGDTPGRTLHVRTAQTICASCPVRTPCLEESITEMFGVWAGLTERERRRLRRDRRREAAA